MPNLDLIWRLKEKTLCPIAAYHVSSEYSSVKAGARMGWLDEANLFREHLLAIRRAGADWIVTYVAREALAKKWI
jgi:porphobilinogen synthase